MMIKHSHRLIFAFFVLLLINACKESGPGNKHANALILETSPYLLQHAYNPVDWLAWSQEALDKAKQENKLIVVSIGYSSCHWCHVMEEETFEDADTATMMNANFISIKVDREERPDVDQVYQTAVQLLKGSGGGWPLNVVLLPNGKPIYGDTYHTKEQWNKILLSISERYKKEPEEANRVADKLAAGIQEVFLITPTTNSDVLTKELLTQSIVNWKPQWDVQWGGNTSKEKFMMPINLSFLMDYTLVTRDQTAQNYIKTTLDKMAMGGVYDHIGGGFYRYSTDSHWKVPHFEKMLYDNAQILSLYSKAYKIYKDPLYRDVVMGTIAFLQREMKNDEGGYYAAMDADSEGEEGKFYVWKQEELQTLLGDSYALFADYYAVLPNTVWENENYVLHRLKKDDNFATEHEISLTELTTQKALWREVLLQERKKRTPPRIDDKILTSWNALLINGYIDAYTTFGEEDFLNEAKSIFEFIQLNSYDRRQLGHSYKTDARWINGFLDDYAFLIDASLKLYSASLDSEYLEFAETLNEVVDKRFTHAKSGMYKYNQENELISTIIKTNDGVLPSPNAVMAKNLFQLGHINYDREALKKSKNMLSSMANSVKDNAFFYAQWNSLLLNNTYPYYEIAVVGDTAEELIAELHKTPLPNTLLVGSTKESKLPLFMNRYVSGDTYIYVCKNNTCKLPVTSTADAIEVLENF